MVRPIADDLEQADAETLMVYLDGTLRYLPFSALHDGERYLIERYSVAVYTPIARTTLAVEPDSTQRVAGLGRSRAAEGFDALPAVRDELDGIVRESVGADRDGILPGTILLDEDFTSENLSAVLRSKFQVVHIASHYVFRPGSYENSYLLLGGGEPPRLSLRDLKKGDFPLADVDLLTLSACETAVGGGEDANGNEVEGLGILAQNAGARSVIATLWSVADTSTALFMQEFYALRQRGDLTTAEALRRAQLAFLDPERQDERYDHPYYWAPFILMGNWL